jgi:acyl-CoA thioester hydrolase
MPHSFSLRVYYEDTDAAGVVYYANYLRFMERARTELLEQMGGSVSGLHNQGMFLVVTHVDITYRRPARLGETLNITTEIEETKAVRCTMRQKVLRGAELLVDARLTFACIDAEGKPLRLPPVFSPQSAS